MQKSETNKGMPAMKKRSNERHVVYFNAVDRPWGVRTGQCISWYDHNKDITNPLLFIINHSFSSMSLFDSRPPSEPKRKRQRSDCKKEESKPSEKKLQALVLPPLTLIRDFDWQPNNSPHLEYFHMYAIVIQSCKYRMGHGIGAFDYFSSSRRHVFLSP